MSQVCARAIGKQGVWSTAHQGTNCHAKRTRRQPVQQRGMLSGIAQLQGSSRGYRTGQRERCQPASGGERSPQNTPVVRVYSRLEWALAMPMRCNGSGIQPQNAAGMYRRFGNEDRAQTPRKASMAAVVRQEYSSSGRRLPATCRMCRHQRRKQWGEGVRNAARRQQLRCSTRRRRCPQLCARSGVLPRKREAAAARTGRTTNRKDRVSPGVGICVGVRTRECRRT